MARCGSRGSGAAADVRGPFDEAAWVDGLISGGPALVVVEEEEGIWCRLPPSEAPHQERRLLQHTQGPPRVDRVVKSRCQIDHGRPAPLQSITNM